MAEEKNLLIQLYNITKHFPGVKALKDVSFDVREGEVHSLCGENGAGKSTLIKVITGAHQKDGGRILLDGKEVPHLDTHKAIEMGISCVYQELSIVPMLDVGKNLFIGNLPMNGAFIDYKKLYGDTREVLDQLGMDISPRAVAGELSVGQQQMIEIGRALTRNARLIIMDEPTSSLSEKETETLFGIIKMLKSRNISIVYISHKLDEVMRISDRVTIIRDGENIITRDRGELTQEELISHMIGRSLEDMYSKTAVPKGGVVLEVKALSGGERFRDISFNVRAGEIVGFFGLVGAGRSEIMRAVFGADRYDGGEVLIKGRKLKAFSPGASIRAGIGFATEDRKKEGLMLRLPILTNMTLMKLRDLSMAGVIKRNAQKQIAEKYVQSISIRASSLRQLALNLSGGNQQKVVIAKWLMMDSKVLIIDEPTRGIDVGSKAEIYGLLNQLAARGVAIVVVSSEIEEIMGISDSIITIFEGRKTAEFEMRESLSREEILTAALGG